MNSPLKSGFNGRAGEARRLLGEILSVTVWFTFLKTLVHQKRPGCADIDLSSVVRICPILLSVLILSGCATSGASAMRSAADFRAKGKFIGVVDNSGSMRPLLKAGDELLVTVVPFEQVRVGMVVVYWPHWKPCPVIHLVVAESPRGFICKGIDNRNVDPEPMTQWTFIGVASKMNDAAPLVVALK